MSGQPFRDSHGLTIGVGSVVSWGMWVPTHRGRVVRINRASVVVEDVAMFDGSSWVSWPDAEGMRVRRERVYLYRDGAE